MHKFSLPKGAPKRDGFERSAAADAPPYRYIVPLKIVLDIVSDGEHNETASTGLMPAAGSTSPAANSCRGGLFYLLVVSTLYIRHYTLDRMYYTLNFYEKNVFIEYPANSCPVEA